VTSSPKVRWLPSPPGVSSPNTAKTVHFGATKDKEAVFQVNGNGPSDVTYVNAADDPRKK